MTTLQIKYGTDIKSESFIIDAENSEQQIYNFTVIVDGSENIAHFTVSNNSSYVEIKQMRNEITVVVKPNLTKDERLNSITFTHNMDSSIVFVVTIKQRARVYGIFVDKLNIQFNTLLQNTAANSESQIVTVTTTGGNNDFLVGQIKKQVQNTAGSEGWQNYTYDNAVNLEKIDNAKLKIVSYGKIAMEGTTQYIIPLMHKNDTSKTCNITITYIETATAGLSFDDEQQED